MSRAEHAERGRLGNTLLAFIGAIVVGLGLVQHAAAQGPSAARSSVILSPSVRPVTSPYLNLLEDDGRGFVLNYYRRVRPELEFRRADDRINRSVSRLEQRVDRTSERTKTDGRPVPTGHRATFMNLGNYFPGLER